MQKFEKISRPEELGLYIAEHGATVRDAAAHFGISKSTVHKDVTAELKRINRRLHGEVQEILQKNKMERHLRGGEATKKKYEAAAKKHANSPEDAETSL
jgi:putative DeoR family transcriptional regulator (stage III sporulation protein D)